MIRRHVVTVTTLALLAGCGGSTAPSDDVPALKTTLDRVDEAIVEGRNDDARTALQKLIATTTQAREDGDLEQAEADRILAAAARVASALPEDESSTQPAPEESPSSTTPSPDGSETPDAPAEGSGDTGSSQGTGQDGSKGKGSKGKGSKDKGSKDKSSKGNGKGKAK